MLNRGHSLGTYRKADIAREEVLSMMAGGKELQQRSEDLGGTV